MHNEAAAPPAPAAAERNREVTYVRLKSGLLARTQEHRARMIAAAPPGVDVSHSEAIRNLIELGLVAAANGAR